MKRIVASAPGKVILSGEYAVLAGAPALSMAVDRRAVTTIEVLPGDTSRLSTPGLTVGEWQFRMPATGGLDWIDEPPSPATSIIESAYAATGCTLPAISINIDTHAFHDDESGRKLGLGSSAAAMTSVVQALNRLAGNDPSAALAAAAAHRKMQGGGSGVDIATSLHGGVILYSRNDATTTVPMHWPDGIVFAVLWSGNSSQTQDMVAGLCPDCWHSAAGKALIKAAQDAAVVWNDDARRIPAAMQAYADCLLRFGIDQGIGIFDAGHAELYELARASGVVYKPSGAGGGDIGITLSRDEERMKEFCANAGNAGFSVLDVRLDTSGARCREVAS